MQYLIRRHGDLHDADNTEALATKCNQKKVHSHQMATAASYRRPTILNLNTINTQQSQSTLKNNIHYFKEIENQCEFDHLKIIPIWIY